MNRSKGDAENHGSRTTMATSSINPPATEESGLAEVKLYSHSPIFYWWPVWLVGFLMALLTYLDGGLMAVVPAGTEARRNWRVEVAPGRVETREGLILPAPGPGRVAHLPPVGGGGPGSPAAARAAPRPHGQQPVPGDVVLRHPLGGLRQHQRPVAGPVGVDRGPGHRPGGRPAPLARLVGRGRRLGSRCCTSRSTWPATCSSRPGCSRSGR